MSGNGSNGDGVVHSHQVSVLELSYDHVTHQVTVGGMPMALSLAQMILGEAGRILEEQRKIATVQALQRAAADQALVDALHRHPTGRG